MYNPLEIEETAIRQLFDLEDVLNFQREHDVQIIREEDYNYMCYIDKVAYGSALTSLGALVFGIKQYKNEVNE